MYRFISEEIASNILYHHSPGCWKICFVLLFTLEEINALNHVITGSLSSSKALKSCKVPDNKSTQYKSTPCEEHNYCGLVSGKIVAGNGTMVTLQCADSYMPRNENVDFIVCYDGVWYPKQHTCLKTCKALNYKSIDANCTYKGEPVACNRNIRIGTHVQWKCKTGYQTDHSNRNNTCLKGGNWKSPISECYRVTCDGLKLKTIEANCSHEGEPVDCHSQVKIGTQLQWKCKPGFLSKNSNRLNICLKFGVWESVIAECIPENKHASAKINPRRHNGTAKVGSLIELHCHVGGYPEPTITWLKHGQPVRYSNRIKLIKATVETIDLSDPTSNVYILYIEKCVLEDSGTYQCRAENDHSVAIDSAEIIVYKKGVLTINKTMNKRIVSLVGRKVTIACDVSVEPAPVTIKWFKSNNELQSDGRISITGVQCISPCAIKKTCPDSDTIYEHHGPVYCISQLTIENAQKNDSGYYKCEALNRIAYDQMNIELIVHDTCAPVTGHGFDAECRYNNEIVPCESKIRIGTTASINCKFDFIQRPMRGRKSMNLCLQNGKWEHAWPTCTSICMDKDILLSDLVVYEARRPTVSISLPQGEDTFQIGDFINLECFADGIPEPYITWAVNKQVLSKSVGRYKLTESGHLQVRDAQISDTGLYTCNAVNELGVAEYSTQITVN